MRPTFLCALFFLVITICVGCRDKNSGAIIPASEIKETVDKANRGDIEAADRLIYHYEYGLYDEVNAEFWRRKAASLGSTQEQFNLYSRLIHSDKPEKKQEAIGFLKAAANGGDRLARRELAKKYLSGESVNRNIEEAERLLILAAEAKDIESMLLLSDQALKKHGHTSLAQAYGWAHMASIESHTGSSYSTEATEKLRQILKLAKARGLSEKKLLTMAQTIKSEHRKSSAQ